MNLNSIINTIELNCQTNIPDILYYASFIKYEKKIPIMANPIQVYSQEWLALSSILLSSDNINKINDDTPNNIEKGVNKNGKPYINITKDQSKKLNKIGYIYEIVKTEYFLPFPTKTNVYKYFTAKPVKINRALVIDNILKQLKELNIIINID